MHDVVIVGVPLVAILARILLNRADVKKLRAEIKELRNEMNGLFQRDRSGDALLSRVTGKLDGRIEAIEKKR